MIDITLLGCGGSMPTPDRYLSSTLISYRGRKILIDCGEGTQVSMKIVNSGFKSIDYICITHIHGDHIIGLPGLLSTIGNSGREEPLTIIGPEGIKEAVDAFMVIVRDLPYELRVIENPKEDIIVNNNYICKDIIISTLEVDHSTPCIAYIFYIKRKAKFDLEKAISNNVPKELWNKLQNGRDIRVEDTLYTKDMVMGQPRKGLKVSLVTDTRPNKAIEQFVKNSDLLICEGMYGDNSDIDRAIKNKHMVFSESANIAKNSQSEMLLLTHYSPILKDPSIYIENATNIFENTILGTDRLNINLVFKE
ncbi:ribonuclease Z [[Clostridium] sordellii]|uniref:ribonuclease Z n=1 Tax=Paraclostridium sordellii TaxID=1505 RepID=UPI0005DBEF42|nr:ribonuclease Z [Paeniclostridium sordellii]MBX9179873.1 ribonuclease Z [Paeniclostridium sordellii]CEO11613.1 ribonuclease Z [[Clostridium] sordellii] [Paeniclostridium sordellii]